MSQPSPKSARRRTIDEIHHLHEMEVEGLRADLALAEDDIGQLMGHSLRLTDFIITAMLHTMRILGDDDQLPAMHTTARRLEILPWFLTDPRIQQMCADRNARTIGDTTFSVEEIAALDEIRTRTKGPDA